LPANISLDLIVSLLRQQHQEIEAMLCRRILDLQLDLISANERIAEFEEAARIEGFGEAAG
jgi:hypothetical protein